jgi:hypothetical protein
MRISSAARALVAASVVCAGKGLPTGLPDARVASVRGGGAFGIKQVPKAFGKPGIFRVRSLEPDKGLPPQSKKIGGRGLGAMVTCVALIASSAIGGSFLALPMTSRPLGFFPSATCMTVCWFYLMLQVETVCWFYLEQP